MERYTVHGAVTMYIYEGRSAYELSIETHLDMLLISVVLVSLFANMPRLFLLSSSNMSSMGKF